MQQEIEFHFDFGSPNAYLAHLLIPALEQNKNVKVRYVPVLVGGIFKATNNTPPFILHKEVTNKIAYMKVEVGRFIKNNGLIGQFQLNPHFPVNSLHIMRGAIAAQQLGDEIYQKYLTVMFQSMWRDGLKMDEVDQITKVMQDNDLPSADILRLSQTDEVKQQLFANTERSVEQGSFGVPSFYYQGELFYGKEAISEFERLF